MAIYSDVNCELVYYKCGANAAGNGCSVKSCGGYYNAEGLYTGRTDLTSAS